MASANARLRDVKAVFHVQNQALATLDCSVSDFKDFKEVLVLVFVPINLHDVLYTVEVVVKSGLVLQDQHIHYMVDCATLMRQVTGQFVDFTQTLLYNIHVLCQLLPNLFPLKDAINDFVRCSLIFHELLLDLIRVVSIAQRVNVLEHLVTINGRPELPPCEHFLLHFEDLAARGVVATHQILEGEDAQDQGQILQELEDVPATVAVGFLEDHFAESILLPAPFLDLVHL